MRVRMLTIMAGATVSAKPGEVIEVDEVTGNALVNGMFAVNLSVRDIEAAVLESPENALLISKNKRK